MRRATLLPTLALGLLMAAGSGATPAQAQVPAAPDPVPGLPPSQNGWEYDIQVADKLFQSGYLDAAEQDYTKILTAYPDSVAGIDEAWLGLARVGQARGETARARASLQEVLRRDRSPLAAAEARDRYRQLRAEAEVQLSESRRAVFYYDDRLKRTSWMNPFGKLFNWLDLRRAQKDYDTRLAELNNFDPRFLIEPVAKPSQLASLDGEAAVGATGDAGEYRLTPEEMAALLRQNGGTPAGDALASDGSGDGAAPTGTGTSDPVATSGGGAEVASSGGAVDLETAQASYFATYQTLRQALASGDAAAIQQATAAYQAAKTGYEAAKTQQMAGS